MSEIWAALAPHLVTITVMLVFMGGMLMVHRLWPRHEPQTASPLEILAQRYARGEIDRAEYEERKSVLNHAA